MRKPIKPSRKQFEEMTVKEFRGLLVKLMEIDRYATEPNAPKGNLLQMLAVNMTDFIYLVGQCEFDYLFNKTK